MLRYLFSLIVFAGIVSCDKDDNINLDVNGTWELVSTSSMNGYAAYPPGNGHLLQLGPNNYLEMREPGQSPQIGHYTLGKKPDGCDPLPGQQGLALITFHLQGGHFQNYVAVNNDTLNLNSEVCVSDGVYSIYRRI